MDIKLDWLSFTFPWDNKDTENDKLAYLEVEMAMHEFIGDDAFKLLIGAGGWEFQKGRKPYSCSAGDKQGVRVFFNHKLPHALVEISGQGCSRIFGEPAGAYLLQAVEERVTRVDIAADIETDTSPAEFVSHRLSTRHKSFSHQVSDTGETCYIGSMSSNRYARVYMYNQPHPRAGVLRAEHVFRQEDARRVVRFGFENGLDKLALEVGAIFGWSHPDWDIGQPTTRELKAHREERTDAATLKWLMDTVAPSVGRLWKDGHHEAVRAFMMELGKHLSTPDAKPVDRLEG